MAALIPLGFIENIARKMRPDTGTFELPDATAFSPAFTQGKKSRRFLFGDEQSTSSSDELRAMYLGGAGVNPAPVAWNSVRRSVPSASFLMKSIDLPVFVTRTYIKDADIIHHEEKHTPRAVTLPDLCFSFEDLDPCSFIVSEWGDQLEPWTAQLLDVDWTTIVRPLRYEGFAFIRN